MARPYKTGTGERLTVYIPRELYIRMVRAMADCGTPHRNAWLVRAIEEHCAYIEATTLVKGAEPNVTQTRMD